MHPEIDKQEKASLGALTEKEASLEYGMSVPWFQRKRWDGSGPPYYKVGRSVRYPRAELRKFFGNRLRKSTSDQDGGRSTSDKDCNGA